MRNLSTRVPEPRPIGTGSQLRERIKHMRYLSTATGRAEAPKDRQPPARKGRARALALTLATSAL